MGVAHRLGLELELELGLELDLGHDLGLDLSLREANSNLWRAEKRGNLVL